MTGRATDSLTLHNRNTRWARVVAECLAESAIGHVVMCPGGRSTALALVLADEPDLETHVQNDERSAGFYALGMARALDGAVAVCTTSGSAVANLLPALVEAEAAGVPILILSCDRPLHEQGGGGPQYADHLALCRPVAHRQLELSNPDGGEAALDALRDELRAFLGRWLADPLDHAPAQINLPFHGAISALDPDPDAIEIPLVTRTPIARIARAPDPTPPLSSIAALDLPAAPKGLIFAGSNCPFAPHHIVALAKRTGFPVLADAASGLRRPSAMPNLIAEAEMLCSGGNLVAELVPDLIIQIGEAPAYHGLHRYLERQRCPVLILDRHAVARDFLQRDFLPVACGSGTPLGTIGAAIGRSDAEWTRRWLAESARVGGIVEETTTDMAWGEIPAAMMVCNAAGFGLLHLGNSMPVRLGNLLCRPTTVKQRVFANRGVNGIDGTIACFLGEMVAVDGPGLALMGDLTFLHDLSSLELVHRSRARGAICVVQNHGGAIFDFLPSQDLPRFAETIRNPRPAPIAALAVAFGLPYHRAGDSSALAAALEDARTAESLHLIEIDVPGHSAREGLQMLFLSLMFG